jgi:hypothetical protein
VRDHRRRLSLLAALEFDARLRSMPVAPRGLHEHMPAVTVARMPAFVIDPARN